MYGTITKLRREARGIIAKTVNLSLLVTMLTLLVTSVIISQTVFSFLPLAISLTVRKFIRSSPMRDCSLSPSISVCTRP